MARVLTGVALLVGACARVVEAPADAPTGAAELAAPPVEPIAGTLGTAHRMVLQAAAPTGHWVVVCQARADTDGDGEIEAHLGHHGDTEGDRMVPYLIREAGPGEAIDEYVGSDRSGRHLAFMRAGRLVLLDTWYGDEVVLADAQVSDDPDPFRLRPAASFDDAGERVAYARRSVIGHEIVVRELASGGERVIDIGGAMLWRFHIDRGGDFVFAQTIDRDTDGDGELTLPTAETSLGDRRCRGTVLSYGHYGQRGDEPVQRAGPAHDGAIAGPIAALGVLHGRLVVRRDDGAIVTHEPAGERVLVPAACAGRIVHVEPATSTVYAACAVGAKPGRAEWETDAPLRRFSPAGEQDLGLSVRLEAQDQWTAPDGLIYADEGVLVVTRTGAVTRGPAGILKVLDDRALFVGAAGMLHVGELGGDATRAARAGERARASGRAGLDRRGHERPAPGRRGRRRERARPRRRRRPAARGRRHRRGAARRRRAARTLRPGTGTAALGEAAMTRTTFIKTMCVLLASAGCPIFPDIESDSGPPANSWPASSVSGEPPTGGASSTSGAATSPTTGEPPPTSGEPFPPSPDPVVSPVFDFLAMDLGDVDGDGHLDLVTSGTGAPPRVSFYPGAGDGSFAQAASVDSELANFDAFVVADVTGDGHADVLARGTGQPPRVGVYAGDGGGGFTALATTELPAFVQMHAADVDGDGRADLLTGTGEGAPPRVQVWRGGPDGVAADPLFTGEVFTYTALRGVDLNGDGHPDLVTAGAGAPPRLDVYAGDGLGGFSGAADVHELYTFSIFDGGDFDGDGRGDIVTDVPGNMWRFALYRSTPDEWLEPAVLEGFNFVAFELGDVDGDGRADIVARPTGAPPRVEVYLAGL